MRKKFMALALSVSMAFSGLNVINTSQVNAAETIESILENKGDTYTLENYVTSLKEAEQIQKRNLEKNISKYIITVDADVDWKKMYWVEVLLIL